MNAFRILADMLHLVAILLLLYRVRRAKDVRGLSLKSQILYLTVFVARYLDLFFSFVSLYNTLMKCFFIASSAYTVFLIIVQYKSSYDTEHDFLRKDMLDLTYLIGPCFLLSLVWNLAFTPTEIL